MISISSLIIVPRATAALKFLKKNSLLIGLKPLQTFAKAAIGSCSNEKVFLTISDPGNQSCSEYMLIIFLLGN